MISRQGCQYLELGQGGGITFVNQEKTTCHYYTCINFSLKNNVFQEEESNSSPETTVKRIITYACVLVLMAEVAAECITALAPYYDVITQLP